jgi:uncharacterized protein (DUF433 family)
MSRAETQKPTVVRTERGLTVGGTRLTIYQLMDHLKAGQLPDVWQEWYGLTAEQVADVLGYIDEHRDTVEVEYEEVLRQAAVNQKYWEERNRSRMEQIARTPLSGDRAILQAKLEALRKARSESDDE